MDPGATAWLTYRGPNALVVALVEELYAEGLTIEYVPPEELPGGLGDGAVSTVELTLVGLPVSAMQLAVRRAYARFRARFPEAPAEFDYLDSETNQ